MRLEDPLSTDGTAYAPQTEVAARPHARGSPARSSSSQSRASLSRARTASPGCTSTSRPRSRRPSSPTRFGFHELDIEDVLSKRQRPKIDEYPEYLFVVLHFPFYDKSVQRLNAAELDVFIGPGFLITLPNVELLPVTYLFNRVADDERLRDDLFSKGSGYLLYHVLDDLFDYCFPILDKIGHKLDRIEDEMFEERAEEIVRDISNVKQEIIAYRKIIKPERATLRVLERYTQRFLPEELEHLLRRHRRRGRADLGSPRQLQGGHRGARVDERVGDLAPPERRSARADDLQRDDAAAVGDRRASSG